MVYEIKYTIRNTLTKALIWGIEKLNPSKDDRLSSTLHELAGTYQTRPQEGWKPPHDWP